MARAGSVGYGDVGEGSTSMRIVHISDTHNRHRDFAPYIPDGDILIHSGDFGHRMNSIEDWRALILDFNKWLGELPHRHKIVICGNHEPIFNDMSAEQIQQCLSNCTYLQDSFVIINGIKIYGSPWNGASPRAYSFTADRNGRKEKWQAIPADTDVLVTHMPPRLVLDLAACDTEDPDGFYDCSECGQKHHNWQCHWGDANLSKEVFHRIKPTVHLFGHCHEKSGAARGGGITFINSAMDMIGEVHYFDYKFTPPRAAPSAAVVVGSFNNLHI